MSTVQSYQYRVDPEELRHRQLIAVESRKLDIAHLQAQQQMSQLCNQMKSITEEMKRLSLLDERSASNKNYLNELTSQLHATHTNLKEMNKNLTRQIETVRILQPEAANEKKKLEECVKQAQGSLSDITRLSQISIDNVEAMTNAIRQGAVLSARQSEIESQLHNVETEIRFLTLHAEMQPAALITLQAMRENGYEFREVETAEGLTTYFEQKETNHQIAVRIAKPVHEGEDIYTWDILAETFEMTGETCLLEIEDFETSIEVMGTGNLKRGKFRVYPKDERSRSIEKHGVIPPIRKQRREQKQQFKADRVVMR